MKSKSWRTTTLGVICIILANWLIIQNIDSHAIWPWISLRDTLHYMVLPFVAFVAGWGLIHARDHNAKE